MFDKHLAKNFSRMTREAEQRELRLRDDMEMSRIQQEQTLGTLDKKIDAMMERQFRPSWIGWMGY